jgi:hypothetical protein
MQGKSNRGRWHNIWDVCLKEADGKDVVFELRKDGEVGLRGGVKRIGACRGHGGGVCRMDWSVNARLIRSCTEVLFPQHDQSQQHSSFRFQFVISISSTSCRMSHSGTEG